MAGPGLRSGSGSERLDFRGEPRLQPFLLHSAHRTGRRIGDGSYGTVEELDIEGLLCAGKMLHSIFVQRCNQPDVLQLLQRFVEECSLLSDLRHPNVVQFLGICFLEGSKLPVLVMEYMPHCLDRLLEGTKDIPLVLKYSILCDVIRGLSYLHARKSPVIHRDLTAKNVLLNSALTAKVADLGVARILSLHRGQMAATMTQVPGTQSYMPPEALEKNPKYGTALDIFSFGHLSLYTIVQEFPYPSAPTNPDPNTPGAVIGLTEAQRRSQQVEQLSKQLGGEGHPLEQLITECLHNDPRQRPSARQLLSQLESLRAEINDPYGHMSKLELIQALRERENGGRAVKDLQAEVTQVEEKQSLADENAELKSLLDKLTGELHETKAEAWEQQKLCADVKKELEVAKLSQEQLSDRVVKMNEDNLNITKKLKTARKLAEKHKTMLDEVVLTSQEAADEHMTRVEEIEERYKDKESQLVALHNGVQPKADQLEVTKIKGELQAKTEQLEDKESQLAIVALRSEVQSKTGELEVTRIKGELQAKTEQLEDKESQLVALRSEVQSKTGELEVTRIKAELRIREEEIKKLKQKQGHLEFEVIALYDYPGAEREGNLPLSKGQHYTVLECPRDWWKARNSDGDEGYIPSNFVKRVMMDRTYSVFPYLSKTTAEVILKAEGKEGGYVLTTSQDAEKLCTLSLYHEDEVVHYDVKQETNYYISEEHRSPTLKDLIEHYKTSKGELVTTLGSIPEELSPNGLDELEVDRSGLILGKELRTGEFAQVVEGKWTDRTYVAIKMIRPGGRNEDDLIKEAKVMKQLNHRNIVKLLGVSTWQKPIYLITELMVNGSLLQHLRDTMEFTGTVDEIVDIASDVCSAMKYLESNHCIHRALAAHNCLVERFARHSAVVKVADFRLARFADSNGYIATPEASEIHIRWDAPEVITHRRFSSKSDVWAFGVLLWEVWTAGRRPYRGLTNYQVKEMVMQGCHLDRPKARPRGLYEVMEKCWLANPDGRPTFQDLALKIESLNSVEEADSPYTMPSLGIQMPRFNIPKRASMNYPH